MKRFFCIIMMMIDFCYVAGAEENAGETLGKAIGGAVGGFFAGLGGADYKEPETAPKIPELKTNTMSNVDTSWLQQKKFKRFCGVKLGEREENYNRHFSGFLKDVAGNINAEGFGYRYNPQLNAIVYSGFGREYCIGANNFFGSYNEEKIEVIITPMTHKVAGIILSGDIKRARKIRYDNGIEVITSRRRIEDAFRDAVGREFFVESGELNVGYGTQCLIFSTVEYPVDKSITPNVRRKICTSVFVGDHALCNLLATEAKEFVAKVNRQTAEDKESIVKQFCGVAFGNTVSATAKMHRRDNNTLWGRFSIEKPLSINGETVDTMRLFTSIKTRRIYAISLEVAHETTSRIIVELMLKKYNWRTMDTPIALISNSYFSGLSGYRCGDVLMDRQDAYLYNFSYGDIAEKEAKAKEQEESSAAQRELDDAFDKL